MDGQGPGAVRELAQPMDDAGQILGPMPGGTLAFALRLKPGLALFAVQERVLRRRNGGIRAALSSMRA
jgi:hypothetical protein